MLDLLQLYFALIAFVVNKRTYSMIASLFLSVGSLILSNTFLGAIAFMIAIYLLTKEI